jgi:hypothetical protein
MTPQSQSRRTLIGLLIIAWGVLDVAVVLALRWFSENHATGETLMAVITLGCYFAQFATLAGWLPLGDGRPLVRGTLCVLTFFLLQGIIWLFGSNYHSAEGIWFTIGSAYSLMVFAPLGVLRLLGVGCRLSETRGSGQGRLQFSILQIFLLTTGTAIVLSIVKQMRWNIPGGDVLEFVLITLALAAIAWITWLSVFRLPLAAGVIVPIAVAPLLGLVAASLENGQYWQWIGFTLITAAGLAINLLVLRVVGYELTRRSKG